VLGSLRCRDRRDRCTHVLGDGVITTVTMELASRTFLLHVGDFSTSCQLPIPSDNATARERSKPKKPDETHGRFPLLKTKQFICRDG
jgi:hypothetical protein